MLAVTGTNDTSSEQQLQTLYNQTAAKHFDVFGVFISFCAFFFVVFLFFAFDKREFPWPSWGKKNRHTPFLLHNPILLQGQQHQIYIQDFFSFFIVDCIFVFVV